MVVVVVNTMVVVVSPVIVMIVVMGVVLVLVMVVVMTIDCILVRIISSIIGVRFGLCCRFRCCFYNIRQGRSFRLKKIFNSSKM